MRGIRLLCAVALVLACQSPEERLAEHRERALGYFDTKAWNEAKIEFMNVLQLDPDDAESHFKMGETLWNLGEFAEARWQFKEAVRLKGDSLDYRMRLAHVESLFQRIPDAMEQVNAVLEVDPNHAQALILRGSFKSAQGDVDGLIADVDLALQKKPDDPDGLRLRARAMEVKEKFGEAEAAYKRLIEVENKTTNRILYALFLQSRTRMDDALAQLRQGVEVAENPGEKTRTRVIVASFHMNQQNPDAAEKELLAAQEESPDNADLLAAIARFYALQGKSEKAEEMLELRAKQMPDRPEPLMALAEFHRRSGNPDKALEAVDRALQINPQLETARLRKAELLRESGEADPERQKQARQILQEVLEENPNSVRGLFTEGKFLLLDNRAEEAAARLRRVIDEQPNSNAHLLLGSAYVKMNQHELARAEFLRAVQLDADNYLARVQLAGIYLRLGERELAIEEAQAALRGRPSDIRALLVLAEANASLNRAEEAADALSRIDFATVEESDEQGGRVHVARLYRQVGKVDQAQRVLDEGLQKNPGDVRLIGEQVLGDLAARDPHGGLDRLNKALEKHPDSAVLYTMRGRVYMGFSRGGQLLFAKEAEADLKKAVEIDPDQGDSYAMLAQLYRDTNRVAEALETYKKAADADPTNPHARLVLGTLYEQSGDQAKAVAEYEAAIRLDPRQPVAKNNLAWLLAQTSADDPEKLDRALRLAQDAREMMPTDPNVADTLGWVMLKKNAPTAAISLFKEALDAFRPGDAQGSIIRYHLAQAYEQNGESDRAIQELEKALAESPSFPDRSKAEELLKQLKAG